MSSPLHQHVHLPVRVCGSLLKCLHDEFLNVTHGVECQFVVGPGVIGAGETSCFESVCTVVCRLLVHHVEETHVEFDGVVVDTTRHLM